MKIQRRRDETGAAHLLEVVIVIPALFIVMMVIIQFGLMFHAKSVAEAAAQEGASVARHFDGTAGKGEQRARAYLTSVSSGTLTTSSVSGSRTATTASVTVTGSVVRLVPLIDLTVTETATGPVERYVPPVPNP